MGQSDNENDDEVVTEIDVVICDDLQNTNLFCLQFPKTREKVFDVEVNPRVRYKKNVRMMEMRFSANMNSGSFERSKMEKCKSESPLKSPVKSEPGFQMNDEIFEGRAHKIQNPYQHVVGMIHNKTMYITPISGIFDMKRAIKGRVGSNKKEDEEDIIMDSDSEVPTTSKQLRVKFSRPETERQKKRREDSALHREKMIASDHWLAMNVYLKSDPHALLKKEEIIPRSRASLDYDNSMDLRSLALSAVICGKIEQLDITKGKQIMPRQRIKDLPLHMQVRAHMMKARALSTADIQNLVEGIERDSLLSSLRQCAHLVKGVWILQSESLFHDLPPAHSNVRGKIDENRSTTWRNARDLALCLLSAGHCVNRLTLSRCFKLDAIDAEEILSTIGVKSIGTWELRIPEDKQFLNDPNNAALILEERRFWVSRWEELKRSITA